MADPGFPSSKGRRWQFTRGSRSIFTSRNEVVAKVMFLHVSVILFTGGCAWQAGLAWGVCMTGGMWGRGMCGTHAPPPTPRDTVSQCTTGTHHTGMHSCLAIFFAENCMKMKEIRPREGATVPSTQWTTWIRRCFI